jgi:glycerol uptake facilitator-like aquaporin
LALPTGISPYAIAVATAAVVAGALMLLAEVTTVISVDLKTTSCEGIYDTNPSLADSCNQVGFERHSVALLLLALLTFAMGSGAAFGRSRPAAVALIAIGVVVLGLALALDLPASDDTGVIGQDYDQAHASAGIGLWFEVAGGAFAVLAGLLRVIRPDD